MVEPDLLSSDAVHSMIGSALPGIALDPTLVHTVHQRTGGNPLFVLALVDHWKTTSAVVLQADGWRAVADFDELGKGVPESLTAMIHQKMDTLSPEEQLLLEAASVAGREFVASVLAPGLGWTEDDAELRCANLARQEHLSATRVCSNGRVDASPRDSVSFTHSTAKRCMNVCRRAGAHACIA